jgi:hypothetical protein
VARAVDRWLVEITGIVGTYTNPEHVFAYDDRVWQEFSSGLLARPVGGELSVSDESHEVAWFTPTRTDGRPMVDGTRQGLADWRRGQGPCRRLMGGRIGS